MRCGGGGGANKATPSLKALLSRIVNVLVIDDITARAVLTKIIGEAFKCH